MTTFDDDIAELTMTYKGKVVGLKAGKGEFKDDSGKLVQYDSTKIFLEMPLRGENSRGRATQELKVGSSTMYKQLNLDTIQLPFFAEIEVRKQTNGKGDQYDEVIGFRVIAAAVKPAQRPEHSPSAKPADVKAVA